MSEKRLHREYESQEKMRAELLLPVCWEPLQERVGRMAELEWLTDTMPAPGYADTHAIDDSGVDERPPMVFVIDFNARDIAGQALQYRAHCTVTNADEYQLDIKPRRTEPSRQ